MSKVLIAVYGTLRRGEPNNHYLGEDKEYLATVMIPGYDMYTLGEFPAIEKSEFVDSGFVADVYSIDEDVLECLDLYEGFDPNSPSTSLYVRKEIDIPKYGKAFVYVIRDNEILNHGVLIRDWQNQEIL